MILPVILSGGSGTRLWPLSRSDYPKQFLSLVGEGTLLQNTVRRARTVANDTLPLVVCCDKHRFVVAEQLRESGFGWEAILLEPIARNTAPAVAAAALHAASHGEDPLLLVMPSDHVITNETAFREAVLTATTRAEEGELVTFGIRPCRAEIGYGYIKLGSPLSTPNSFSVAEFVEKPDLTAAQHYFESGEYFWNSGMFLFRSSRFLEELQAFAPEIFEASRKAIETATTDLDFLRLGAEAFQSSPVDSVDYAVMERTTRAAVITLDAGWNDLGSWSSLWEVQQHDADGNLRNGQVLSRDVKNSLLRAESRLVAALGVENLLIVETADAVLVASRNRDQDVKALVSELRQAGYPQSDAHRKVYRPWGSYDSIDADARFQVKRITVNPGASLSLQMHHHRSEHWIVVQGTARVTVDDTVSLLSENQSAYIPLGARHRLENPGHIALELIEVQSGAYLGEDDIVRFDDVYGRQNEEAPSG